MDLYLAMDQAMNLYLPKDQAMNLYLPKDQAMDLPMDQALKQRASEGQVQQATLCMARCQHAVLPVFQTRSDRHPVDDGEDVDVELHVLGCRLTY